MHCNYIMYALNVFVRFSREVLTETTNTEFFVEIIVIVSETECDAKETRYSRQAVCTYTIRIHPN